MIGITRILGGALAVITLAGGLASAFENPPDNYLCYSAVSPANKNVSPIGGTPVGVEDRFGGPQSLVLGHVAALCNSAGIDGGVRSHPRVHLVGITSKREKGAPKFVPSMLGVANRFGTSTLVLKGVASVLDVTPVQPGTVAPADFSDDPTTSSPEVNRFECYAAGPPKGASKRGPLPPAMVGDSAAPSGRSFVIKKVSKVCAPANIDGATPDAPARNPLLVCYAVKLPRGAKVVPQTVGTHSLSAGVRIVDQRRPAELCVVGQVVPSN